MDDLSFLFFFLIFLIPSPSLSLFPFAADSWSSFPITLRTYFLLHLPSGFLNAYALHGTNELFGRKGWCWVVRSLCNSLRSRSLSQGFV